MAKRWLRGTATALALLALSGCSPPLGSATPTPVPTMRPLDGPALLAREAASPDPNFDYGLTIQITPAGARPAQLVSPCCNPITFKNLTPSPVIVILDNRTEKSGSVPPGGAFVWTPKNVQSLHYHLDGQPEIRGAIQVNQTFDS